MPYIYSEIRDELKKKPKHQLYRVNPKKEFKLIAQGDYKRQVKKELKQMKVNEDDFFMLLSMSFHSGTKSYQGGPLKIMIKIYRFINGSIKNIKRELTQYPERKMSGAIWFGKKFLERKGWSSNYITDIIKQLVYGRNEMSTLGKMTYEIDFA